MIDKSHKLPVSAQCRALDIARSTAYYQPAPAVSAEDLDLMRQIDEIYLQWPFTAPDECATNWPDGG